MKVRGGFAEARACETGSGGVGARRVQVPRRVIPEHEEEAG